MLYMSGGGVQIFSMGIVFMLLFSPFKNVAGLNTGVYLLFVFRRVVQRRDTRHFECLQRHH